MNKSQTPAVKKTIQGDHRLGGIPTRANQPAPGARNESRKYYAMFHYASIPTAWAAPPRRQ